MLNDFFDGSELNFLIPGARSCCHLCHVWLPEGTLASQVWLKVPSEDYWECFISVERPMNHSHSSCSRQFKASIWSWSVTTSTVEWQEPADQGHFEPGSSLAPLQYGLVSYPNMASHFYATSICWWHLGLTWLPKCMWLYVYISIYTGWWFGTFFVFPYIGKNNPNWLIFFIGVETTNQYICKDFPCPLYLRLWSGGVPPAGTISWVIGSI